MSHPTKKPFPDSVTEAREKVFEELWDFFATAATVQKFSDETHRAEVGQAMKSWLIDNHERMKREVLR